MIEQAGLVSHVGLVGAIDCVAALRGERDHPASGVFEILAPSDEPCGLESIEALRDCARRDHRLLRELAGGQFEGRARTAQGGENIELALAEAMLAVER